jgi:hypothetical protein
MHRLAVALIATLTILAMVALARLPVTSPAQAGPEFRTQPPRRSPAPVAHLPLVQQAPPTPTFTLTPTRTPTPSVIPTGSPHPSCDVCARNPNPGTNPLPSPHTHRYTTVSRVKKHDSRVSSV